MPRGLREFTLDRSFATTGARAIEGPGASAAWPYLAGALHPRFQVAADRPLAVRRVWLDTFDWRLYRAGLGLEYISRRGFAELSLVTREGTRIVSTTGAMTWPGLSDTLPRGPLRERVAPVVGIRALLPILSSAGTMWTQCVLDSEKKTVARLTVDDGVVQSGTGTGTGTDIGTTARTDTTMTATALPTRLTVTAVRGYDGQADRIGRLISELPGISPASRSALDTALAAVGRKPGSYTSKVGVQLAPATPAGPALAGVLLRLLEMAEANVEGVIRDIDTEFLHDLRIAVRRTRSALKLAGDALPGDMAVRFTPEFRWLGQLTTPSRDLDVHLLGFQRTAAGLITAAPEDLQPLHASLVRYRVTERRSLIRGLRSARFACLTRDWRGALSGVVTAPDKATRRWAEHGRQPVANLAAARIRRAHQRLVKTASRVTPASPDDDLHTVRKRGKELRYLLEFFATLHEPAIHRGAVRELKQLQDCLGEIQDGHVQREAIRALAARMVEDRAAPAATLLAMGELAAQLDAAASVAREGFAKRFAQFTSARNTQRIALLTKVAA